MAAIAGKFKIVVPIAARNWILNPSAEIAGNYVGIHGGETITRQLGGAWGEYCWKIVPGAVDRGIKLSVLTPDAGMKQVCFAAKGVTGDLTAIKGASSIAAAEIAALGNGWTLYQAVSAAGFDGATTISISNSKNETWYLDGVNFCAGSRVQTYLDGDQPGCWWTGTRHASASVREATSRVGGEIYSFESDFKFRILSTSGGMPRPENAVSERPFRNGGSVDMTSIRARTLVLLGVLVCASGGQGQTHAALLDVLKPDAVPLAVDGRPQPVVLQYWGAERILQLRAHYAGGMDDDDGEPKNGQHFKMPLMFDVAEPYWEEVVERALEFDSTDTTRVRMVFGRLDGEWTYMGPPNAVTMGNPNGVWDILETDEYVFVGGHFSGLNGDAAQSYLARYNKESRDWDSIGTLNDAVHRILMGPNGEMYICGEFTTIDAADMGSGVARYNFSTKVWTKVGNSFGTVANNDMLLDGEGNLYVANGVRVYRNSGGAAWTQIGSDFDSTVYALEISPLTAVSEGRQYIWLYAGGNFTGRIMRANLADVAPAFATFVVTAPVAVVYDLEMTPSGVLYLGTSPFRYYREGDGALSWPPDVPDGSIIRCKFDARRNELYVTGSFTQVGDLTLTQNAARFFPASQTWAPLQFSLNPGTNPFYLTTVHLGLDREYYGGPAPIPGITPAPRPPLARNLWFGFFDVTLGDPLSDLTYPAKVQVVTTSVPGGAESKPVLRFSTDSLATINSIVNRTTGAEVILNADIIADDTVFVDLVTLRIWSQYAETGEQKRVITPRPGSRFAGWSLLPTGNDIEVRVNSDAGTITGVLRYVQRYHSYWSADVVH